MKILVLQRYSGLKKLSQESGTLIKHLDFWQGGYHQVDIFAYKNDNKYLKNLKNISILKSPRFFPFFIIYIYIVLYFKSAKYDLIIEVWNNSPWISLIFNRRRKLIVLFGSDFKPIFPKKLFKLIYSNCRFLVNNISVQDKLCLYGIKQKNIEYIPDGVNNHRNGERDFKLYPKKNKILIICGKDYEFVFSYISMMERKSLDWKFVVLTDNKNISNFKKYSKRYELAENYKILPFTLSVFISNIKNSKFLVITPSFVDPMKYMVSSLEYLTPVSVIKGFKEVTGKNLQSIVLWYENQIDLTEKLLEIFRLGDEYARLCQKIYKLFKPPTWEEVGKRSLGFVESL